MVDICCDHTQLNALPEHPALERQRRIGFFPGSSLGNFTPEDAVAFLRNARQVLTGGPLLRGWINRTGPDGSRLRRCRRLLRRLRPNPLQRLNRDLQGDADRAQFRYLARWQEQQQRIEMALVSTQDQTVHLAGEPWAFKKDDP